MNVVEVRFEAPQPGTYKFDVGSGGNGAALAGLSYRLSKGETAVHEPHTYRGIALGSIPSTTFFYIPKGIQRIWLDVYGAPGTEPGLLLYKQLSPTDPPRRVTLNEGEAQSVELEPGEAGTIAEVTTNGFQFPYLRSVPRLWAFSRSELLVPRAIAKADQLTIIDP